MREGLIRGVADSTASSKDEVVAGRVGRQRVYDLEGVLGLSVVEFVGRYVRSLLTWDILVFFHRNPDAVLDLEGLATRLGRRKEDLEPEIEMLDQGGILKVTGGLIHYRPSPAMRETISEFVNSCQDRGKRLALIAIVLRKINPPSCA